MISTKPYFFRAIYEWACDSGHTPQIIVDATADGVVVPLESVKDGQIALNIHAAAVSGFTMDNDGLSFAARFTGRSVKVQVPMDAVLAIYARETGHGIYFKPDPATDAAGTATTTGPTAAAGTGTAKTTAATGTATAAKTTAKPRRSHLQLVKSTPPASPSPAAPSPPPATPPPSASAPSPAPSATPSAPSPPSPSTSAPSPSPSPPPSSPRRRTRNK